MVAIPFIIMAATAAITAYGAVSSAKAQSASYKNQAKADQYNATVNSQNADASEAAGSANELALRRQNEQRMGAIRAQIGAKGGGFTGTNLALVDQDASNMELDALNTRYRGQMEARGLLSEANLDQYGAITSNQNAGRVMRAGYLGAASSALGSFANYSRAGQGSI